MRLEFFFSRFLIIAPLPAWKAAYAPVHFSNLKKSAMTTSLTLATTFIDDLKSEFENRITDFKTIENVVDILSNIYSLNPGDEWCNEAANIFGSNKAAFQMEMIDFQENTVLKQKNRKFPVKSFG